MASASQSAFTLDLDLDCYLGPFDLLLTMVLRDEMDLLEVPVAEICVLYLERLAACSELDLEAASEFLVLVAALCELKVRLLLPGSSEHEEETPEEAADELAARLHEYARARAGGEWLRRRREQIGRRVFRDGPAPLAPRRPEPAVAARLDPECLRAAVCRLLEPPPELPLSHLPRRVLPVRAFLDRFRTLLAERRAFGFEDAVRHLNRMGQAVAFWAVLELYRRGEAELVQTEPFGDIRVLRTGALLRPPADVGHSADDLDAVGEEAVA